MTAMLTLHVFKDGPTGPVFDSYDLESQGAYVRFKSTDDNAEDPANPLLIGVHQYSFRKHLKVQFNPGLSGFTSISNLRFEAVAQPSLNGATLLGTVVPDYLPPMPEGGDLTHPALPEELVDVMASPLVVNVGTVWDGQTEGLVSPYGSQSFVLLQLALGQQQTVGPITFTMTYRYDELI